MRHQFNTLIALLLFFSLLLAGTAVLAQGDQPYIGWWILASGGGASSAGNVTMESTLGEPIVGPSSGGVVSLRAGYQQGNVVAPVITPAATSTPASTTAPTMTSTPPTNSTPAPGEQVYLPLVTRD